MAQVDRRRACTGSPTRPPLMLQIQFVGVSMKGKADANATYAHGERAQHVSPMIQWPCVW